MISMVSIFLVLMLTLGANPAYIDTSSSVINPQSTAGKININQKPRLGVKKNFSGNKGRENRVNAGPIYKKQNKNTNSCRVHYYGHNRVHMKTYEQRGHHNNAGDVYTYDDVYRLTNVKINVPDPTVPNPEEFEKEKTFNFDKLDNIMSIVETQNEQTTTKTTQINPVLNQYENFDGWGLSYDLNGNTTQKSTQSFTYNYRNQVIKAKDQTTEANYKYDALGRRIQKAVTVGSTTKTTNYYYSGIHVIEERDGSDNVLNQYIYGNGIDEILRMDKYNGASSTPYYFHTNGIGSVTAITDANGDIVERVSYDTFGMPTFTDAAGEVVSKSTIGNPLLFHGRRYDAETNLYYFRARYYDPIMGRFLQTDPMGYEDSMNLYQGFGMNPVNFVDPMGLYKGSTEEVKWVMSQPDIVSGGDFLARDFNKFLSNFKSMESFLEYSAWWLENYGQYVPGLGAGTRMGTAAGGMTVTGEKLDERERSIRLLWGALEFSILWSGAATEPKPTTVNKPQTNLTKPRYVYDARTGNYRDLNTGQFVSKHKLPYPTNSGFVYKKPGTLKPGAIIDRYGKLSGRYAGQPGESISSRGMPQGSEALPYTKFEVIKPIPMEYGPAASVPEFGATGGATQYYLPKTLQYYLDKEYIRIIK